MPNEITESVGAAAVEESAGASEAINEQTTKPADAPEKKYTDEDLNRILANKIARERRKLTQSISGQLADELDAREKDILRRELRVDARETLAADGLPASLADLLNYESKEDFDHSYQAMATAFRDALQEGVKMALRGSTPRVGSYVSTDQKDPLAAAFRRKD